MTGYADSTYLTVTRGAVVLRVRVDYWAKPIPLRQFDYEAVDDATYDGAGCVIGHGATEAEAIADLIGQLEDNERFPLTEPSEDEAVLRCREPYTRARGE